MIPPTSDAIWFRPPPDTWARHLGTALDITAYIYLRHGHIPDDPTQWAGLMPKDLHRSRRSSKAFKRDYDYLRRFFLRLPDGSLAPDPEFISLTEPQ